MSKSPLPISPFWTRSSSIPIHLDITEQPEPGAYNRDSEHICQKCAVNSRQQPIHCVQRTPCSPAPPSYHSVAPPSNNLSVPTLNLETSRSVFQPRPARPALKFDLERRPRVRFRRSAASPLSPCTTIDDVDFTCKAHTSGSSIPNTPEDEINRIRKSKLGLGIPEAQFKPDPSPIRSPGSETLARAEKGESTKKSSPNIAERIEQKLWDYNTSGNVAKRWLIEIVSWTLSAICMAAIIVPLFILRNKPAPRSWPLGITLNAYIAVLSKIASASLLLPASEALGQLKWNWFQGKSKKLWDFEIFDNASRGPWGSFLLLVRTKGTTLAALGAAITIFAMALDPFFQQIVHNTESWQLQPLNSSIPKIIRYSPPPVLEFQGEGEGLEVITLNKALDAIADSFFFDYGTQQVQAGNGARAEIPVSCPTTNCTWEPYETLGFCSECADVADMLSFGCHQAQLDWIREANPFDPYENGTMCGWFFNATGPKPMLMSGYQADPTTLQPLEPSGQILTTRLLTLTTNINMRSLFGNSIHFKDHRLPLADFVVVSPSEGLDYDNIKASILRHEKPRASECAVSWCVKTIESSYFEGMYTEVVKEIFVNKTTGPYPWTQVKVEPPPKEVPNAVRYFYFQNVTVDPHSPDGKHGNTTSYGASNDTAYDLINLFFDYLPAFETILTNDSLPQMKYKTRETVPFHRLHYNNPWLAPNNITYHMERLATTMTNDVRMTSQDYVSGKSFSEETFIDVRWPWLSLPVGLLLLTFIFLVTTIIRTPANKDGVGVWKTSAVATLFYGLPEKIQQQVVAMQPEGTPRAAAQKLNVKMLPMRNWRISGMLFSPALSVHRTRNQQLQHDTAADEELQKHEYEWDSKVETRVFQTVESCQAPGSGDQSAKSHKPAAPPGWI